MDSSTLLLQKLADGDLSNIVDEVKVALKGLGRSSLAIRALARISNLCIKHSGNPDPKIADDVALQLIMFCGQAIAFDLAAEDISKADNRTIHSIVNILSRFNGSGNAVAAVRVLSVFVPIFEKMTLGEQEQKSMAKLVSYTRWILTSASASLFLEGSLDEFSPLYFWDLMLQVSSLVSVDECITQVLFTLKSLSEKYGSCNKNTVEIQRFNKSLLDKLIEFSETKFTKLEAKADINQVFGVLINTMWYFLRTYIASGSMCDVHQTVTSWSKFVVSLFSSYSDHLECFNFITMILRTFLMDLNQLPSEETFVNKLENVTTILELTTMSALPAFKWVVFICGCSVTAFEKAWIGNKKINSFLTHKVLNAIHLFTKPLSKLLLNNTTVVCKDANGEVCPFKGDAVLALKSLRSFVVLCIDCNQKNNDGWTDLLPLIKDSYSHQESILTMAVDGKCVQASFLKEILRESYFFSGNLCHKTNNWGFGHNFLRHYLKYMYKPDRDYDKKELKKLTAVLQRLSVCCENEGLRKEAKVSALLCVILNLKCGTPPNSFICDQWASLQNLDPVEAKSAEAFWKRESELFKSLCLGFEFDAKLVSQLQLWELSCYLMHRMKSSDIVLSAWLSLKASKPTALILLEGSAMACQALFTSYDNVDWHELLAESLPSWFSQVEESEKAVALCIMAIHYQTKFLILAQSHFDENESKVEELCIYTTNPAVVRQPQDVVSPSDLCQVRSSFPNLNLHREQKLMDLLDTAVNYWNDSLKLGLCIQDYERHPVVTASGEYLLQVGFFYTLWGYDSGAAKTFKVCCQFAQKMSLDDLLLQAQSSLMNTIEVENKLITESEALLERLECHDKILYLTKFYQTSRAFQALRTSAYAEGVEALKKVVDLPPTHSSLWCFAYTKLLQASYSLLPKSKIGDLDLGESQVAHTGLSCCIQNMQGKTLSSSPLMFAAVVNQTLASSLWIGRYYSRRLMPRQARSFLKPELKLALKLGLATRAAEFICELAFVDLLTENVDEATAKIVDLQSILGDDSHSETGAGQGDAAEELDDAFSASDLVPRARIPPNNLGASPSLHLNEVFHLPIANHGTSCECYVCRNFSVQNVWLLYSHLQAKVNVLRFDVHKSLDIYNIALKAAQLVFRKLRKFTHAHGFLLQNHQLACTDICMKIDFVDMLVMYGKDDQALKRNNDVLQALKNLKTDENQLYGDAVEQKMCIVNIIEEKAATGSKVSQTPSAACNLPTSPVTVVEKTPEQSAFISTPRLVGKQRLPLRAVAAPSQLVVPLTDQQFFTPKAKTGFGLIIDSDDEEFPVQPSKKDASSVVQVTGVPGMKKPEATKKSLKGIKCDENKQLKKKTCNTSNNTAKVNSESTRTTKTRRGATLKDDKEAATQNTISTRRPAALVVKSSRKETCSQETTNPKTSAKANATSRSASMVPQEKGTSVSTTNKLGTSQKASSSRSAISASTRPTSLRSIPKSAMQDGKLKSEASVPSKTEEEKGITRSTRQRKN